jgi:hypothetical protein
MLGASAAPQSVVEHCFMQIEYDTDLFGCSDSLSVEEFRQLDQMLLPRDGQQRSLVVLQARAVVVAADEVAAPKTYRCPRLSPRLSPYLQRERLNFAGAAHTSIHKASGV